MTSWQQGGNTDDATNDAPLSLVSANGRSAPTQLTGTSHHSDQPNSQTREISADLGSTFSTPHHDVPHNPRDPSHKPSPAPRPLPNSGNSNDNYLFSSVRSIRVVLANNQKSDFDAAVKRIDEVAEVTQTRPPPFRS